jgi:hypothetical protein
VSGGGPVAAPLSAPQAQFSNDPNSIVTVEVATVSAPTPNTFQQQGALVTFGGSNLVPQSAEVLTQASDLNTWVAAPINIATITYATGEVTVTLASPLPAEYANGSIAKFVIAGVDLPDYNGLQECTIVSSTSFTYPITTTPAAATVMGTAQPAESVELLQMVQTFFGQGNRVGVWVLELGWCASSTAMSTALTTWLTNNNLSFYGYLMPRACAATPTDMNNMGTAYAGYSSNESMTYFWVTVLEANISIYTSAIKNVVQFIEAPKIGANEFTCAAMFYNALAFKPSNVSRCAPMAFRYLYGVTPYPTQNNGPLLKSFKTNNTNYVSSGAEGGISYNIVYPGVTKDGYDYFNWWWTIDWVQINVNLDVSNAIINGANNPVAPLYYDQTGINSLQTTLAGTMMNASVFGMVQGRIALTQLDQPSLTDAINAGDFAGICAVNAVPFINYTAENPGDYKIGEYDGLAVTFIPARGFIHVLILVTASSLVFI